MKTCNQEKSALEKGILKMGLTRSASVTRELVNLRKLPQKWKGILPES